MHEAQHLFVCAKHSMKAASRALQEARPSEDPADLIFMEPDLLSVHPSEEAYDTAKGRAVHAIRIFRGTHRDAIYLTKEVQSLRIPCERRISDLIKVSRRAFTPHALPLSVSHAA